MEKKFKIGDKVRTYRLKNEERMYRYRGMFGDIVDYQDGMFHVDLGDKVGVHTFEESELILY